MPVLGVYDAQEAAAQHRRQRDRDEARDQDRARDGHGKFAEEPAEDAPHEQDRDEHGADSDTVIVTIVKAISFDPFSAASSGDSPASHNSVRQVLTIAVGISSDKAREINKMIKEKGPKGISSQTQGDTVRVTGKKRDDLQSVIATLKGADLGIPLQFQNFRD